MRRTARNAISLRTYARSTLRSCVATIEYRGFALLVGSIIWETTYDDAQLPHHRHGQVRDNRTLQLPQAAPTGLHEPHQGAQVLRLRRRKAGLPRSRGPRI